MRCWEPVQGSPLLLPITDKGGRKGPQTGCASEERASMQQLRWHHPHACDHGSRGQNRERSKGAETGCLAGLAVGKSEPCVGIEGHVSRAGQVFCGKRTDRGKLDLPGGKAHPDEAPHVCAQRELIEELVLGESMAGQNLERELQRAPVVVFEYSAPSASTEGRYLRSWRQAKSPTPGPPNCGGQARGWPSATAISAPSCAEDRLLD